jgi:hypothetical protein
MSTRTTRVLVISCVAAVLAVVTGIVVLRPFAHDGEAAATSRLPERAASAVPPGSPSTAAPAPAPNSPPQLTVTCSGPPTFARGQRLTITYVMDVTVAGTAVLGAALYSSVGDENSVGISYTGALALTVGRHSVSRQITIPSELPPDTYELNAEVWPAGTVRANDMETIADASCVTTTLP